MIKVELNPFICDHSTPKIGAVLFGLVLSSVDKNNLRSCLFEFLVRHRKTQRVVCLVCSFSAQQVVFGYAYVGLGLYILSLSNLE